MAVQPQRHNRNQPRQYHQRHRQRDSRRRADSRLQRHTLPDGTLLTPANHGPDVNATYPLGAHIEDYEYVANHGDLDEHNGRFCVTPDYPAGTYAYFITVDAQGNTEYPYIIGPTYYGVVEEANYGPGVLNVPTDITYYRLSDIDIDAQVGVTDYVDLAANWLGTLCSAMNQWCYGSEIVDTVGRAALS